jgi:hypothetical protein
MNRQLPMGAALVALMMAVPGQAHAWTPLSGCAAAGAGFQTCASFQVQIETVGERTQVYIRVRNDGILDNATGAFTHGSSLSRFAVVAPELENVQFGNIGSIGQLSAIFADGGTVVGNPEDRWVEALGSTHSLGTIAWGVGTSNHRGGINSCVRPAAAPAAQQTWFRTCGDDQWLVFAFNTNSLVAATDFQLAWGVVSASHDDGSYQGSTTTVPEPLTMALLGTGLIGVTLVARRRRSALESEQNRKE